MKKRLAYYYELLKTALGDSNLRALIKTSAAKTKLSDLLATQSVTPANALLFVETYKAAADNDALRKKLVSSLKIVAQKTWQSEFLNPGELLVLVFDLLANSVTLELSANFHDALLEHARSLLGKASAANRFAQNWLELLRALSPPFRSTFEENLADLVCEAKVTLIAVLAVYGDVLARSESLPSRADRLFLNTFPGILSRMQADELKWVQDVLQLNPKVPGWAKTASVDAFRQRLSEAHASSAEADRNLLKAIMTSLNIEASREDADSKKVGT